MQKPSWCPKVSFLKFLHTSHLSPLFKTTSNVSYPRERIKTRGYTFEFKSNLNSNENQLIPILLGVRREGAWFFVREKVSWETFSRVSNVAHKMDKDERASDKLSIQIQTCFEFEWLTNYFIHPYGTQMRMWGRVLCEKNFTRSFFSWIQMGARKLGDAGNLKQGGLIQIESCSTQLVLWLLTRTTLAKVLLNWNTTVHSS